MVTPRICEISLTDSPLARYSLTRLRDGDRSVGDIATYNISTRIPLVKYLRCLYSWGGRSGSAINRGGRKGVAMTTAELIRKTLKEKGQSQRAAAREIGVTLPTFNSWRGGLYIPDPTNDKTVQALADWSRYTKAEIVRNILVDDKGMDPDMLREAMGVYVSSDLLDLLKVPA